MQVKNPERASLSKCPLLDVTIDTLREQSRQKDEEIERLRQIILNLQRAQFGQRSEKRTYILDDGNQ